MAIDHGNMEAGLPNDAFLLARSASRGRAESN
jgi:hypothetical protein